MGVGGPAVHLYRARRLPAPARPDPEICTFVSSLRPFSRLQPNSLDGGHDWGEIMNGCLLPRSKTDGRFLEKRGAEGSSSPMADLIRGERMFIHLSLVSRGSSESSRRWRTSWKR
jgi:hypothetical protein